MAKPDINVERLKQLLHYEPENGIFTWRIANSPRVIVGDIAGNVLRGYRDIGIDGSNYKAHRLAWLYVHGAWPTMRIDHINGVKDDNRISNLRDVSQATNNQNRRAASSRSTSGFLGVTKIKDFFRAVICVNGKTRQIGNYQTPESAHEAYLNAKRALHSGCTI